MSVTKQSITVYSAGDGQKFFNKEIAQEYQYKTLKLSEPPVEISAAVPIFRGVYREAIS